MAVPPPFGIPGVFCYKDCNAMRTSEQRSIDRRTTMAQTVAKMTKKELREMIETAVEQKLLEILGDPDEGLAIRRVLHNRLLRQKQAVAAGARGQPLEDVVQQLGLK